MKLDMHFHSTMSDGMKNSIEIIEEVKEKGLDFAVCSDHDIINEDFPILAKNAGIETCEAVEVSANDSSYSQHLHLTCYSQKFSKEIKDVLDASRSGRQEKAIKQIKLLQKNGFIINEKDFYDFFVKKGVNIDNINSSHLSSYIFLYQENIELVKKLTGESFTRDDFIKQCLKDSGKYSWIGSVTIEEYEPDLRLSGELARQNNAVLSFAHPNFKLTQEEFRSRIEYYLDCGINAVEINSQATEDRVKLILEYQKRFEYLITFGSDCHFKPNDDKEHGGLGFDNRFVTEEIIRENFKRLRYNINKN